MSFYLKKKYIHVTPRLDHRHHHISNKRPGQPGTESDGTATKNKGRTPVQNQKNEPSTISFSSNQLLLRTTLTPTLPQTPMPQKGPGFFSVSQLLRIEKSSGPIQNTLTTYLKQTYLITMAWSRHRNSSPSQLPMGHSSDQNS